ncbi:MAG: ABC transporter substrate-binding protein [Flavobacteriales bacterium]|nr:ABC transporter substrate-binding protein [Flavobacteriales bacterium]
MRWLLVLFMIVVVACSGPAGTRERRTPSGKYYGGVFNANETEELSSLFPLSLVQAAAHRIGAQMYDGLVRLDQNDLSVIPSLATSWEVDASGTEYVFHLQKGVMFHPDACLPDGKGRELKAQDVVACFNLLCTNDPRNKMNWLFQDRVVGANAHFAATSGGVRTTDLEGITAVDAHTVKFTLTRPWPGFLQVLAHQGCWIFAPESYSFYGEDVRWHPVGTGPFRLKRFDRGTVLILERSPDFWGTDTDGSRLPYLDAIRYTFESDKGKELDAFLDDRLSAVYELPIERTDAMNGNGRYVVQSIPALSIQFYGFNSRKPPFTDVRVRKAFSLAIDRRFLVDSVLDGLAVMPQHGVVAPGLADYPYDDVPGPVYDPEQARKLLAEAGYPAGRGLPTVHLQVNNNGFGYVEVAGEVQGMLERELGARVISTVLPAQQHFERVERGEAQFWREGWIVDHPDPENFLALFYGRNAPADTTEPSFLNSTRHRDPEYDSLFGAAARDTDVKERMALLARAETRLMSEYIVIPLYYERSVRLLRNQVRDLPINGMEYRDLRAVWMDPEQKTH